MSTYINLTEAAKELGITVTSLYKIVNHEDSTKQLEPINRNTQRGDGGYRFLLDDVLQFKRSYVNSDLTSAEAARRLGRSTTYIHKLIRNGDLPYYEQEYRGKRTYFIKENDLMMYMEERPDAGKSEVIYDKRKGLFLFQPFINGDSLARIMELKRVNNRKIEAKLLTSEDQILTYENAVNSGWKPQFSITERKPINGYGYARFEFPYPKTSSSMIYSVIEELFKHTGPANMKINVGQMITIEVRKSVLVGVMPATHPDLIDKLKLFMKSGEIISKYDGTLIDTGLTPVTIYLSEDKKQSLIRQAEKQNMSLQAWMEYRLMSETSS